MLRWNMKQCIFYYDFYKWKGKLQENLWFVSSWKSMSKALHKSRKMTSIMLPFSTSAVIPSQKTTKLVMQTLPLVKSCSGSSSRLIYALICLFLGGFVEWPFQVQAWRSLTCSSLGLSPFLEDEWFSSFFQSLETLPDSHEFSNTMAWQSHQPVPSGLWDAHHLATWARLIIININAFSFTRLSLTCSALTVSKSTSCTEEIQYQQVSKDVILWKKSQWHFCGYHCWTCHFTRWKCCLHSLKSSVKKAKQKTTTNGHLFSESKESYFKTICCKMSSILKKIWKCLLCYL